MSERIFHRDAFDRERTPGEHAIRTDSARSVVLHNRPTAPTPAAPAPTTTPPRPRHRQIGATDRERAASVRDAERLGNAWRNTGKGTK